jgi:hypothetical protein
MSYLDCPRLPFCQHGRHEASSRGFAVYFAFEGFGRYASGVKLGSYFLEGLASLSIILVRRHISYGEVGCFLRKRRYLSRRERDLRSVGMVRQYVLKWSFSGRRLKVVIVSVSALLFHEATQPVHIH